MSTSNPGIGVPTWGAVAIVTLVGVGAGFVFVYGGWAATLGSVVLGSISTVMGLFTLYLFYRFVVAVEKIADKY
jgi:hypothetical protein